MADRTRTTVGILCADGVEQVEVTEPRRALDEAGFDVRLLSPGGDEVRGYHYIEPGDAIGGGEALETARPEDFSCLVIPGGLGGPDTLRKNPRAVELVREYWKLGRPVATICHGPWLLIEASALQERTLTCAEQITTDVVNAGGRYVDRDAYVDSSRDPLLVSGRNHDTVGQFAETLVATLHDAGSAAGA